MLSRWVLSKTLEFNCSATQGPDSLVNVAHKFNFIFPTHYICQENFVTTNSYKAKMETQISKFHSLSHDCAFWNFISNKQRIGGMPPEIEDFIRHGIPPELRSKLWQALAGVETTPLSIAQYHELSSPENSLYSCQIEKDIYRTFEISDPTFIAKLTRVLTAYSNYNPKLGYCQSMNILAATLLIFMEEEHAYSMLVYLVEELMPNFHSHTLSGYHEAEDMFKFLLAVELPDIYIHFQNLQYNISAFTSRFLSLFVKSMPNVTAFVMWDNIFMRGPNGIFEAGLAILQMMKKELLQINDFGDMMTYIPERLEKLYNPNKLLKHWKPLAPEKIKLANEVITRMKEEVPRAEAALNSRFPNSPPFIRSELEDLWIQYVAKFSLSWQGIGLEYKYFGYFFKGTFREWDLDENHLRRLFDMLDVNQDGAVDFPELVCFLFLICRGSIEDFGAFNLQLFDIERKGKLDKHALTNMLTSMYSMFSRDYHFCTMMEKFVNDIFGFPTISTENAITKDNFHDVVEVLPQIHERFKRRNPETKFILKNTYFFWMYQFLTCDGRSDIIQITFLDDQYNL